MSGISWEYEKKAFAQGYKFIAGIDEVGRGSIAGPVVAAAVILPSNFCISGIDDSKKLSPQKREQIYPLILDEAMGVGVGIVGTEVIDKENILRATYQAMQKAILHLPITPDFLLLDWLSLSKINIPQESIPKGDSISISIAAASIVAKVTRDKMMIRMDQLYPQYGFGRHKGYGTKDHLQNIEKYGICEIHRRSFLPCKNILNPWNKMLR